MKLIANYLFAFCFVSRVAFSSQFATCGWHVNPAFSEILLLLFSISLSLSLPLHRFRFWQFSFKDTGSSHDFDGKSHSRCATWNAPNESHEWCFRIKSPNNHHICNNSIRIISPWGTVHVVFNFLSKLFLFFTSLNLGTLSIHIQHHTNDQRQRQIHKINKRWDRWDLPKTSKHRRNGHC